MKKPTIKDVAEAAGVSIATVSRVLNNSVGVKESTRNKVYKGIRETGYTVGSQIDPSSPILVVMDNSSNDFFLKILEGIQYSAQIHGNPCLIIFNSNVEEDFEKFKSHVQVLKPAGLILLVTITDPEKLNALNRIAPVVQCAEFNEHSNLSYVSIDGYKCTYEALEYMISSGKRNIALINGPLKFRWARERLKAYKDIVSIHDLNINPIHIINLPNVDYMSALTVATHLLSGPDRPEAVFCTSDIYAVAVLKAALGLGIDVPKELGIIGFDNIDVTSMTTPTITTINQPKFDIGYIACETLFEKIMNPLTSEKHIMLSTNLMLRQSF